MAKLIDSVKALGEAITGEKINGDTLFDAVKDAGEKMTGKEIEGKELNDVIVETAKEYQGGGGTKVVTELPQVGEPHIIYELRENKVIKPVVVMIDQQMIDDKLMYEDTDYFFAFTTTEEMTNTFNSIPPREGYDGDIYLNYITSEDKLIGAEYVKGAWRFTEATKVSDCKFDVSEIFELEDEEYVVILKEYFTAPIEEWETFATGTLWNGKTYTFNERNVSGIILGTPTVGVMTQTECGENLKELPPDTPSDEVFETIPYEKIINYQLPNNHWYFTPKGGEVTEISYWIYTNDEWVNIDETGNFNTITIPIRSIDHSTLIPLNKVHFYLDNKELELVTAQSPNPESEDCGYLVVPLLDSADVTYQLHIVFDNDVRFGSDCTLINYPVFTVMEDNPHIQIIRGTQEYDFEIYVGYLILDNNETE